MPSPTPLPRSCLLALTLMLASCQSGPDANAEKLPLVRDIGPSEPLVSPVQTPAPVMAPIIAHVVCLDFPPGADLEHAWSVARAVGVVPPSAELWHANGMRVALVGMAQLNTVTAALPPHKAQQVSSLIPGPLPVPCAGGWTLTQPVRLKLTLARGRETTEAFDRGRFQFLAQFGGVPPGAAIDLTPHLNIPSVSLMPRLPAEMQLDGRRFEELTLHAYLMPGEALMVGVDTEPAPAAAPVIVPARAVPAGPAASQPTTRPAAPPARVIVPSRLGTALLTGPSPEHPLEVIMFLAVEPRAQPVRAAPK